MPSFGIERNHLTHWGSPETGYPPPESCSIILSMLVFLSSNVIVTVKDLVCRLYFDIPSVLVRIDLILSCGSPQPPLGRLGTVNLTVVPAVSETALWGANSIKRLANTKNKTTFLYFMGFSFFNNTVLLHNIYNITSATSHKSCIL